MCLAKFKEVNSINICNKQWQKMFCETRNSTVIEKMFFAKFKKSNSKIVAQKNSFVK